MEIFNTIISGVAVFVLGQILLKLIIEPIQDLKKEIATTLNNLIYYANIISNPNTNSPEKYKETSQKLRQHASNLASKVSIIPFYILWVSLRILPPKENIFKAKTYLIYISNSLFQSKYNDGMKNSEKSEEIQKLLNSYFPVINLIFIIYWLIILSVSVFYIVLFVLYILFNKY